jgi:hypothetical protein
MYIIIPFTKQKESPLTTNLYLKYFQANEIKVNTMLNNKSFFSRRKANKYLFFQVIILVIKFQALKQK